MKRLISAMLTVAALISLISCGEKNRAYNEDEVKSAVVSLIKKSEKLNDIYWGEGIGYYEDDNYANGYYYPADPLSLSELGFDSLDELREKTKKVFSDSYSQNIFEASLTSYGDEDNGILGYARYYEEFDVIMVYSRAKILLSDKLDYLYDTLEVTGSKGEVVWVKLSVEITRGERRQTRELNIGLIEEEDGWRIDTPTYMTYRENDDYKDLQGNKDK